MAIQLINIGNVANDGTGDDLREAMIKINANFEEIDLRDDEQTTASNLGFGSYGIFKQKLNYDLQFKGLIAGTDVTIEEGQDTLVLNAAGGIKSINLRSDVNNIDLPEDTSLKIFGGADIDTVITDGALRISYAGPREVVDDLTPTLGGNLDADLNNISNVAILSANTILGNLTGDVTGLVHGIDIRNINTTELDFGATFEGVNVTSTLDWFLYANDVDYGTFSNPTPVNSDFGNMSPFV